MTRLVHRCRLVAALATLAVLMAAGCGSPATSINVNVFAAASLAEPFIQIGADFERDNPGVKVVFSFGGSSTLAAQVNQGAPADVFASASSATMKAVIDAGNGEGDAAVFARNQLVIAVPAGNPKAIARLADLARPGLKVAVCAEQVPCGAAARTVLDAAAVPLTPVTLEQDVKAALAKVVLGEVDAALVYRTDAIAASSDVDGIELPESADAINDYLVVALRGGPEPAMAAAFVAYVRSAPAAAVLTQAGFGQP